MPRYEFPHGVPAHLKALMAAGAANFVLWFAIGIYVRVFAPLEKSGINSFATYWKGSVVRFVPPLVGYYLQFGFWAHFLVLAVVLVMSWYFARTGRAVRVSGRDRDSKTHTL